MTTIFEFETTTVRVAGTCKTNIQHTYFNNTPEVFTCSKLTNALSSLIHGLKAHKSNTSTTTTLQQRALCPPTHPTDLENVVLDLGPKNNFAGFIYWSSPGGRTGDPAKFEINFLRLFWPKAGF